MQFDKSCSHTKREMGIYIYLMNHNWIDGI